MIDAFARAMRKPQQVLSYVPGFTSTRTSSPPPPGTRLKREPDGPVSLKLNDDTNLHVPSPFRIGYDIGNIS